MAKLNSKAPKMAGKVEAKSDKLSKVNPKSVTIQKADKKKKDQPVKHLKKLEKSDKKAITATSKPAQKKSPKKEKKPKKDQSPAKAKKAGKFEKKNGSPAGMSPNKKAKKLPKGPKSPKPAKANAKKKPQAAATAKGELVSKADIGKTLAAFRSAVQVGLADKKAQLDPDFKYILQLCCFKIPQCPERIARTQLAHTLYDETDDVCLFVKDVEAGHKRDYQPSIDYFKEKLAAEGITNVTAVMPMTQIVQEYKQHEMIRKLSATYDCFLADARIAPHLAKLVGKQFLKTKKSPIPVRMNHKHLKEHFDKAMAKVQYHQTSSGDSIAIYVGKHNMEESKVIDNIYQALKNMQTEFPGGWPNIKRAYLRPAMNLKASILVYANASSGEDVRIPVIEGPKAKAIALQQKKLNDLLPEGMLITNKGELAMVANAKKKADKEVHKEKQKAIKEKKVKAAKPDKKKKEKNAPAAVESEAPVAEKAKEAAPAKKEKKGKKAAEAPPTAKPVEEVKPVDTKKSKKSKTEPLPAPSAPVEVSKPAKPAKKNKKEKAVEVDPADEELSKEVSALWEQIKNESAAELALDTKKGKKKAKAAPVEAPAATEPADKKKNKRKVAEVVPETAAATAVSSKKVKSGNVDKKKSKK